MEIINSERRMLINNVTQDIIDLYHIQIPIQNVTDVVTALGGRVEESVDTNMLSDSGIKKQDNGFIIYVSPSQSPVRRKYSIAYELGHLFLHMGYKINPKLWNMQENAAYYKADSSLRNYQAYQFAEALFMPQKVYKEIMAQYTLGDKVEIAKIASYFGVSISEASQRGKTLGYLQ